MSRKYINPDAHGYLLEAKACEKVGQELRRITAKLERTVCKEAAMRQAEFVTAMQYGSEHEIQDDYGWEFISESQYERYLKLFREGQAALETHEPTVNEIALSQMRRILSEIEEERREWAFSALSRQEQVAERARAEQSQKAWKEKIEEIKRRRSETNIT